MNINELFENIQDRFQDDEIKGEFILQGNCIVWEYCLDDNCDENESHNIEDDDEQIYSFDTMSSEELLNEVYRTDFELIEGFIDELNESNNWTFSNPETNEDIITFKIF